MTDHIYKNPKKYSENNALQYNFAMKVLGKISFYPNSRVLDIGCGDGVITHEISKICHKGCILGTDISTQMVEHASKEYFSQENLRFVQMDAAANIFRQQFDIVTSFNCLHWIKDQEAALSGIANSAVDGAQIVLLLSHRKSAYHFVLDELCSSDKWAFYFKDFISPRSYFDLKDYNDMVLKTGLTINEITEEEMTYYFRNKNQIIDFFSAAGAQIKQIPESLKSAFLNDFADGFVARIGHDANNMIPVSFWCLQVIAQKPTVNLALGKEDTQNYTPALFSRL